MRIPGIKDMNDDELRIALGGFGFSNEDIETLFAAGMQERLRVYADPGSDYAIVVGIDHYAKLPPLRGAIRDAQAFVDWLVDPEGGALPRENVHYISSSSAAKSPTINEVDQAFADIFKRVGGRGGRRLYFYFCGYGCQGDRNNDVSLCLVDWSGLRRRASINIKAWLDVVVDSGLFMDVAVFMDIGRVWNARAVGKPPHVDFVAAKERKETPTAFIAQTTELQRPAIETNRFRDGCSQTQGIFSEVLVRGLRGAADDYPTQMVTSRRLKDYLEYNTRHEGEKLGLKLRAEVINGFTPDTTFGDGVRQKAYIMPPTFSWYKYDDSKLPFPHFSTKFVALCQRPNAGLSPIVTRFAAPLPKGRDSSFHGRLMVVFGVTDAKETPETTWVLARNGEVLKLTSSVRRLSGDVSWQMFDLHLTPGTYTLRQSDKPAREMAVLVQSQRTTRVILGDLHTRDFDPLRIFVGTSDSTAIVDPGRFETLEWALAVLQGERSHTPAAVTDAMQNPASIEEPMLGLVAAHLQARETQPNPDIIEAHIERIETSLGPCPDTLALRIRVALIRGREISMRAYADPPMLREGLLAFIEASHLIPEVIATGSVLERACIERMVDGPFTTWSVSNVPPGDWLTEAVNETKREAGERGNEMNPLDIARELAVPTLAVKRRI